MEHWKFQVDMINADTEGGERDPLKGRRKVEVIMGTLRKAVAHKQRSYPTQVEVGEASAVYSLLVEHRSHRERDKQTKKLVYIEGELEKSDLVAVQAGK